MSCVHSSGGGPSALTGPGRNSAVHELSSPDPEQRLNHSVSLHTWLSPICFKPRKENPRPFKAERDDFCCPCLPSCLVCPLEPLGCPERLGVWLAGSVPSCLQQGQPSGGMGSMLGVHPQPPNLLGKARMRLCHRLNLQCSALALISHFLPSLNGADQIKPCQHRGLTGGWCCVVNVTSVPWWLLWKHGSSTPLGSRGPPSLLSACRLWPFKAGRIMGEGHVGSTGLVGAPQDTSPQASEPTELTEDKQDESPLSVGLDDVPAWGAGASMCQPSHLCLGSKKGGSQQAPPVPPPCGKQRKARKAVRKAGPA